MSDIVNKFLRGVYTTILGVDINPLFDDGDLKVTYSGIDILVHVVADIAPCADLENRNNELDTVILFSEFLSNPKEGKEYFKVSPIGACIDSYVDKIVRKIDFMYGAYTLIEGLDVTSDFENSTIEIKYGKISEYINVSIDFEAEDDDDTILLECFDFEDYRCSYNDHNITEYAMKVVESLYDVSDDFDFSWYKEKTSNESNSVTDANYIAEDLSIVKVIKLMYCGELRGYRFYLIRGCLDISVERGTSLGLSQDKVVSEVELEERGGILVSDFEIINGFLVQNISDNIEICNKLLKSLLVPVEDW